MRQARVGVGDGGDQRVDHLALDPVGEMARVGDVGELAPAVGDLLVLGERVGDQRKEAQVGAERGGEGVRRRLALRLVRVLEPGEQRLERQALALEVEAERRHRVVEQPVPRGGARHRLLQEQLLDLVGELVRLLLADVLEPRAIVAERRRRHRGLQRGVVDPVELELEKQEVARERRHLLVRVAVELRPGGVAGVAGVEERGVGHDAPDQVLKRLVGPHRLGEVFARRRRCGDACEPAAPAFRERLRLGLRPREICSEARRVHALVEIVEPPLRQGAGFGRGGGRGLGGVNKS